MIKNLFYSALILGALAVCAYAKPMDAEAAKKIPELSHVLSSVRQQERLNDQDRVVVERNLASGDPVLVSLAAFVVAESKEAETDLCAKAKDALDKASAMPQAYIRLMLTKKKAQNTSRAQLTAALEPLLKDPNPYLRVEAAKEILKADSFKGERVLETMLSDDSVIVKGEAFRELHKRGKTGGSAPAPMTDERYELLLSIVDEVPGMLDTRRLLSEQPVERSQALEGLTAKYREVCAALLKTLEEAKAQFRTDRRYHSPLHAAILAVDAWRVFDAEDILLSMVDYELDPSSLPLGMNVFGDYFYPAARVLVHLRVDNAKVERAIEAAENPKTLRILTWVLLERGKDIERVKKALADASGKSHGVTEKQNFNKALELLNNPSKLLPMPSRGNQPSSK